MTATAPATTGIGLTFSVSELITEIGAFTDLVSPFLMPSGRCSLSMLAEQLAQCANCPQMPHERHWSVGTTTPVRTIVSTTHDGQARKANPVYAVLSGGWHVCVEAKPRKPKERQARICGLSSWVTKVFRAEEDESRQDTPIAHWQFDIAYPDQPGCHVHMQVTPFTATGLRVPRFPSIAVTPLDALEFTIAELFPDEWRERLSKEEQMAARWAKYPRGRTMSLLRSIVNEVERNRYPWVSIRDYQVPRDLFMLGGR